MSRRSPPSSTNRGSSPTPAPPTSSSTSAAHSEDSSQTAPVADDAVHLLSELSANAVIHSDSGKRGGTFTVRAQHVVNAYVRGEVEDGGSDWHGELPASATHPHGLYLLLMLASACGVERISRAHVVWFRLDYPNGPAPETRAPPLAGLPQPPHRSLAHPFAA